MSFQLDLHQALRGMRRGRTLNLATVLILGLGIGAAATMYAVVHQVLLRPLPVRDEDRLVVAWGAFRTSDFGHVPLSYSKLSAIRDRSHVFEQIAGLDYNGAWAMVGRIGSEAVPFRVGVVAGDLFGTLGVETNLGRLLTAEDDRIGAAPVALISRGFWLRRFGGDTAIIGKSLPIWGSGFTIVGVLGEEFELPAGAEAWISTSSVRPEALTQEDGGTFDLVGRLRPGHTLTEARAELDRLLLESSPNSWAADSKLSSVVHSLRDVMVGQFRPALLVILSAALLVFLVAVLNLGSLLAVRAIERQPEFALRRALGASGLALVRQIVVEAGIIVGSAGILGLMLAWASLRILPTVVPQDLPRIGQLGLNSGVIFASLGLSLVGVALASLLPGLSVGTFRVGGARLTDTRPRDRIRALVVALQVALAVVTVTCALLLVRTLSRLQQLEPGFESDDLTVMQVAFLSSGIKTDEQATAAIEAVLARASGITGVAHIAAVLQPPLSGTGGFDYGFVAEGQSAPEAAANPYLNFEAVTPDYFATFRIPILRGRTLSAADGKKSPAVVVISQGMSARMWPGQDPIGKRIRWADSASGSDWRTIVGVVNDSRYRDLIQLRPNVYVPVAQQPWVPSFLAVRSKLPRQTLIEGLRRVVQVVDPGLDVINAAPMTTLLARPLAQPRFNAGMVLAFGGLSVLLAVIGLYGQASFVVARRTREIGIRLAVGAEPRQILGLFLRRLMAPVALGCAVGVGVVLALGQLLSSVLFGVTARDPIAIVGAVLGFSLLAFAAALVPAHRAAEGDPVAALRAE